MVCPYTQFLNGYRRGLVKKNNNNNNKTFTMMEVAVAVQVAGVAFKGITDALETKVKRSTRRCTTSLSFMRRRTQ